MQSVVNSTIEPSPCSNDTDFEAAENISDRLERLSSAFDAIQKYLEEQSTVTTSSVTSSRVLNLIRYFGQFNFNIQFFKTITLLII